MHTTIKIAVVSVLALFAIVGVESISKAEYTSVNSNGTHYNKKYRLDGKFALINLFDENPPLLYDAPDFSFDTRVHDPRGRLISLTIEFNL